MAEKRTPQGLVVGLIPEEAAQEAPPAKKPAKSGKGGKNKPPKTAAETGDTTAPQDGEGEKETETDAPQDGEGE